MRILSVLMILMFSGSTFGLEITQEMRDRFRNRNKDRKEQNRERQQDDQDRQIEQARKEIEKRAQMRRKIIEKLSLNMIKSLFKKAQEDEKEENWGGAYTHYHDVSTSKLGSASDYVLKSKKKIEEIESRVDILINNGRIYEHKNEYVKASKIYRQIIDDYEFCPQRILARRRLAILERTPRSASIIKYDSAFSLEKNGELNKAKSAYEKIAERYPEELAAMMAAKRLKSLPKNDKDDK